MKILQQVKNIVEKSFSSFPQYFHYISNFKS